MRSDSDEEYRHSLSRIHQRSQRPQTVLEHARPLEGLHTEAGKLREQEPENHRRPRWNHRGGTFSDLLHKCLTMKFTVPIEEVDTVNIRLQETVWSALVIGVIEWMVPYTGIN